MLTADTPANGIDLLRTDGDFVVLGNGSILRLLIQPDDSYSINDYDSDGRVEWVSGDSNWWPVRYPRPDGFTGRARIIERDHGSALWWEPYWDLTEAQISAELPRIKELCQYGFSRITLELCRGRDYYGLPIVVDSATIGGVDAVSENHDYLQSVLQDLLSELDMDSTPQAV